VSYVELHSHSAFSLLDGASHPVEIAAAAAEQGHSALALTDHDSLGGVMELAQAAGPLGVRTITGAELTLDDGSHLTLLCQDRAGYRNLCRLITLSHQGTRGEEPSDELVSHGATRAGGDGADLAGERRRDRKRRAGFVGVDTADIASREVAPRHGEGRTGVRTRAQTRPAQVTLEDIERRAEGLVCLSGCASHGLVASRIVRDEHAEAAALGRRLLTAFGPDRFRVELQRPFARQDRRRNRLLASLAERLGVPAIATGNAHAHDRSRAPLQDALVAVRLGTTLDESEARRRGNTSHALASPQAMAERFCDHPEAVRESGRLAERLTFDVTRDLGYRYPGSEDPAADRRLAEICRAELRHRYDGRSSRAEADARLEEELGIIRSLGLAGFFLLHREMLELAREVACRVRGRDAARSVLPPGRGRGSSVSSIVCYLTGLSHVDPIEKGLFLGRFLNEELTALPDIDLDFPRDVREALIPMVHERFGHDRSALVASYANYRVRGAIRDLGKALGLPPGEVERAARAADPWEVRRARSDIAEAVGERRAESPRWQALFRLVEDAYALPRHASQHPGGMVISTEPLVDMCPIQPAAMEGRQVVQWDKDSCGDAGFLKIDLLGLGMLSAVEDCVSRVARVRGERIDLSRIPLDDREVYREIQSAETMGVFQIESRAQMQMLVRTLPESLDDLTVQVALVRPGPIQGGAVHPYIERRRAQREDPGYEIPYEHPSLEPVLRDTLGAIVFQDQVLEVAMAFAGFAPSEAEGLRRAMSRKRSEAAMRAYEQKFLDGAVARGASRETAERVYAQIVGFSGFGFPKAHSAAFGLLAYQSTWLRVHYGPEFLCALLNEQPMGFYPPDTLVHEAQRRRIPVLPPDVLSSSVECTVEWVPATPWRAGPASGGDPGAPLGTLRAGVSAVTTRARGASEHGMGGDSMLAVRLGLGYVNGVREVDVREVVAERERGGAFGSVTQLASRCSTQRDALERLAWAGACDSLVVGPGEKGGALWTHGAHNSPLEETRVDSWAHGAHGATGVRSAEGAPDVDGARNTDGVPGADGAPRDEGVPPGDTARRRALWLLGVSAPGTTVPEGAQLALPLEPAEPPALPELTPWERMLADYGSTSITLREHPLELLRPTLADDVLSSAELERARSGERVRLAGLVVARQRPATARGVTFILLEDEHGTINLIVQPPVYERCRQAVRTEPVVLVEGRLERREGTANVVVSDLRRLERPDQPLGDVRHIEPSRAWSTDERGMDEIRDGASARDDASTQDLGAVAPVAHSFGRRGR
jgi:error-prone DNA polymerase